MRLAGAPTPEIRMTAFEHLGDAHNFGRRVSLRAGVIVKPRAILWEWLLLGRDSPLCRVLDEIGAEEGLGDDAFSFLPRLHFRFSRGADRGGEVEAIKLSPPRIRTDARRRALAEIVGRAIALFAWLGVADLHWENLVLGAGDRGQIVFGPVDVEMILADMSLPTETKLLPDSDPEYADVCRHAAGVRRVLPYLGKPIPISDLVAMASAYRTTLEVLDRSAPRIAEVLVRVPKLGETPIRVGLRGTDVYVRARTEPIWPPLLAAEAEQLARGDIPYFFRLYDQPGIRYFADHTLRRVARIPLRGDVPKLEPLLQLSRSLRSPARKRLREDGLFCLLGAFDHPSFAGRHRSDALEVGFRARSITVRFAGGDELSVPRNLSGFVGSVYLPCRCGEVRSVFVPPVTRCEAQRRTRRDPDT